MILRLGVSALGLLATGAPHPPPGDPEHQAVLAVPQAIFEALAARDAETLRRLFLPEARITSLRPGPGGPLVRQGTVEDLLASLAASRERWLERLWNPVVHLQGRIAVVWTPYDFHRDGRFSHSGIDTFVLVKTGEGWRISSLTYSVEPERPSAHPAGPPAPARTP